MSTFIFEEPLMTKFQERLIALRKTAGISQTELGEIVGLAQRTISNYENKESEPSIETLIKLADYFDVSVDYLIGRIDNQNS